MFLFFKNYYLLCSDVNKILQFLPNWSSKDSPKRSHRRSSSFPVNLCSKSKNFNDLENSISISKPNKEVINELSIKEETTSNNVNDTVSLKAWSSFPDQLDGNTNNENMTIEYGILSSSSLSGGKRMTNNIKNDDKENDERVTQSIELSDVNVSDFTNTTEINSG